jgi:uncharacterized protein (AIM24 family)
MSKYTISEFIKETAQKDERNGFFELESPHTLEINLQGKVWAKLGSMVGYTGNIDIQRQGLREQGLMKVLGKALTGEGMTLMKAEGQGKLYLADNGKKVRILSLQNEAICVNGNDILALEDTLNYDIKMMQSVAGVVGGGLFNVKVEGKGMLAITTHGEPITLLVTRDKPVYTDPNATVAWSGSLEPEIKTNISWKYLLGRGSGETFQLAFKGEGWVVLQPYEEIYAVQK